MKLSNENLIKTIITRLHGVIDEKKALEIYESCNITIVKDRVPVINGNVDAVLDKLLRSLVIEGNYLVKITLHNLALENGLNICPLCQEATKGKKSEKNEKKDDPNKDLSVEMLHDSPSKKIILIKLRNGSTLNDHAADCPINVLCVSGHGTFEAEGKTTKLEEGTVLTLGARIVHNVKTDDQVELLLTKFMKA